MDLKLLEQLVFQPAFPPQLIENNFGQLVAPVTGFNKLEYAVLQLLPVYIGAGMANDVAINEAIATAKETLQTIYLAECEARKNQNQTLSIT